MNIYTTVNIIIRVLLELKVPDSKKVNDFSLQRLTTAAGGWLLDYCREGRSQDQRVHEPTALAHDPANKQKQSIDVQ